MKYNHYLIPPDQFLEGPYFWPHSPRFVLAVNMETLQATSTAILHPLLNPGTGEGPSSLPQLVNSSLAGLLTKTTPEQSRRRGLFLWIEVAASLGSKAEVLNSLETETEYCINVPF